jgi:hypothetical protein
MKASLTSPAGNQGKRPASRRAKRMPRLDTIKMVEDALKSDVTFATKNQLWRSLPKQVQYPTFMTILDYLEDSNKIMYVKDGSIVWTFVDTSNARKSLKESTPL